LWIPLFYSVYCKLLLYCTVILRFLLLAYGEFWFYAGGISFVQVVRCTEMQLVVSDEMTFAGSWSVAVWSVFSCRMLSSTFQWMQRCYRCCLGHSRRGPSGDCYQPHAHTCAHADTHTYRWNLLLMELWDRILWTSREQGPKFVGKKLLLISRTHLLGAQVDWLGLV